MHFFTFKKSRKVFSQTRVTHESTEHRDELSLSFSALFSQHIKIQYFPTRTTALPLSDAVNIPNVAGSKYNIKCALTYAVVVLPFGWNLDVLSTSVWFFGQVRTYSGDQTGV